MQISKLDRYCGATVGAHAGDSVGAPYEKQRTAVIQEDMKKRGGLVLFGYIDPWGGEREMPPGHPTDDAELLAITGQCLVDYPDFDPNVHYERLRGFIHGRRSFLTKGEAYGSGRTLRAALRPPSYRESLEKFGRGEVPIIPTNGGLMRILVVALRYHMRIDEIVRFARWQSCITHMHPLSQAACIAYCVLVSQVLDGHGIKFAWDVTRGILSEKPYAKIPHMDEILSIDTSKPGEDIIWPDMGSVKTSLRAALWASFTASDFRDGITKVVELGGDTDTYGAIAGGILGAHFGVEGIPQEWRDALIGRDIMLKLADDLYALAHA